MITLTRSLRLGGITAATLAGAAVISATGSIAAAATVSLPPRPAAHVVSTHHAAVRHTTHHVSAAKPTAKPAAAVKPTTVKPTVNPAAAATVQPARTWSVTLDGAPWDMTNLDTLSVKVGARPNIVMWYTAWSLNTGFPTTEASNVANWGATPEITWEPWNPANGVNQPSYSLARIAGGSFDTYLRSWATGAKAYGKPVQIRFAHEMNGNWYPWAEGVNGNSAGSYIRAWNHVRSVFAAAGVTNVVWVWSPNVPYTGSTPLNRVFPGDAQVDEVALDGYNWGTLQPGSTWTQAADVFGAGVAQLSALSARPLGIGEIGCPEAGGDKAQWITNMWNALANAPRVRNLTWFDFNKEADWRIDSSVTSAAAFAAGIHGYLAG